MEGQYFIADHINGTRYSFGIGFKDLKSIITSFQNGLSPSDYYITCNGKIIEGSSTEVQRNQVYHVVPRVCGGKGGFGSMLRAIGAQIEKTTNHEACRDISGRRMRDVNNERQLREWIAKKAEKEKEREEQRQERINRRRAMPNHKFDDPLYDKQKSAVAENLEDAFKTGFAKVLTKDGPSCSDTAETAGCSYVSRKRKAEPSSTAVSSKKNTEWLGIDENDLSSSDNEEDDEVMKSTASSESGLVNIKSEQDRITNTSMKEGTPSSSDIINSADNSVQVKREIEADSTNNDSGLVNIKSEYDRITNTSMKERTPSSSDIINSGDNSVQVKREIEADSTNSDSGLVNIKSEPDRITNTSLKEHTPSSGDIINSGDNSVQVKRENEADSTNSDSGLVNIKSDPDRITNTSLKEHTPSSSDIINSGDNSVQVKREIEDDGVLKSQSGLSDSQDQLLTPKDEGPVDLDCFSSAEELESEGLDRLKVELMSRGLKCGGNLQERARRLFSVKGLTPDQYDPSLLAKAGKKKNK